MRTDSVSRVGMARDAVLARAVALEFDFLHLDDALAAVGAGGTASDGGRP